MPLFPTQTSLNWELLLLGNQWEYHHCVVWSYPATRLCNTLNIALFIRGDSGSGSRNASLTSTSPCPSASCARKTLAEGFYQCPSWQTRLDVRSKCMATRLNKNSTLAWTPHSNRQGRRGTADGLDADWSHRAREPSSHWVNHELLGISQVQSEVTFLKDEVWPKLGHQQNNDPKQQCPQENGWEWKE